MTDQQEALEAATDAALKYAGRCFKLEQQREQDAKRIKELEAERDKWKAEYLSAVDRHNETLDELREYMEKA